MASKQSVDVVAMQTHQLKRELKLGDLILLQILLVLGLPWIGWAAKEGSSHVFLWCAAILFFYLPLGAVVIFLSRTIPVEGGLYQWIKVGLSPFAGYMAAWNYSVFWILLAAGIGTQLAGSIAYVIGPAANWMTSSKFAMALLGIAFCASAFWINVIGLHLLKRFSGLTSLMLLVMSVAVFWLLFRWFVAGSIPVSKPFSLALPVASWVSVGVFGKLTIAALGGLECSSIAAGECWAPERNLALSVTVAAPIIALIYVLGTGSFLAYIPASQADLSAPLPQLLRAGFGTNGFGASLATIGIIVITVATVVQTFATVAVASRLPMVAGWDGLLPKWWAELHPRHGTPVKALGAITASVAVIGVASLIGLGQQEAIHTTTASAMSLVCLVYILLFSSVLFGIRRFSVKPSTTLRLGAFAGLMSVVIALFCQLVPLTEVRNPGHFALKIIVVLLVVNVLGAWLYSKGRLTTESMFLDSVKSQ